MVRQSHHERLKVPRAPSMDSELTDRRTNEAVMSRESLSPMRRFNASKSREEQN
jgi:hypothetical protein